MTLPSLSHDWPPEDLPASTTAPAPLPDPAEPLSWVRTLLAGLERRRSGGGGLRRLLRGHPAPELRRGVPRRLRPALGPLRVELLGARRRPARRPPRGPGLPLRRCHQATRTCGTSGRPTTSTAARPWRTPKRSSSAAPTRSSSRERRPPAHHRRGPLRRHHRPRPARPSPTARGVEALDRRDAATSSSTSTCPSGSCRCAPARPSRRTGPSWLEPKAVWPDTAALEPWAPAGAEPLVRNPLGVVPLVPLRNRPRLRGAGRSEIEPVTSNQDAINYFRAMTVVGARFLAYPQRVLLNVVPEVDPTTGLPKKPFKAGMQQIWMIEPPDPDDLAPFEPKVESFAAADLTPLLRLVEGEVRAWPRWRACPTSCSSARRACCPSRARRRRVARPPSSRSSRASRSASARTGRSSCAPRCGRWATHARSRCAPRPAGARPRRATRPCAPTRS